MPDAAKSIISRFLEAGIRTNNNVIGKYYSHGIDEFLYAECKERVDNDICKIKIISAR